MAHLKMLETRQNPRERQRWKFQLVKGLYEQGYSREDVLKLFRFINWLISLPPELEQDFWRQVQQYQEEGQMPFITNLERVWLEQGIDRERQQERQQMAQKMLQLGLPVEQITAITGMSAQEIAQLSDS